METKTQSKRVRTPNVKTEVLSIFIWRSRQRGFLVVPAHDLEEARAIATALQPNLNAFVTREPEAVIAAQTGEVAYLKQRP